MRKDLRILENFLQKLPGIRFLLLHYLLRRTLSNNPSPLISSFRTKIDDPVGILDHIQVMLDYDHRVPGSGQPLEDTEEFVDIGEVKTGRRFIEDIDGLAGTPLAQFPGQFNPLGFAAREGGGGLAQLNITQPHIGQRLELILNPGNLREKFQRLIN